jgi:hypothetical protein
MAESRLTDDELERRKVEVLRLQAGLARQDGFFLAGGTGLALRLRHRFSDDLDWFTPGKFDAKDLIAKLKALPRAPSSVEQGGQYTVRAYYDKVETSFIMYAQVPARPEAMKVAGTTIAIADVGLQAAMKAAALHDRGARRDFIDIHAIAALPGWSIAHFIDHAARQLPLAPEQVARALTYFVDAEKEPMPRGCKVPWEKVKKDIANGVREWDRKRTRGFDF